MFTITFYSFKGGVGRTLSMMNSAYRLSKKGRTVFILDFDIEAPGVDVFSADHQPRPGLLDYISAYQESGVVPELEGFVSEMPWRNAGKVFYMSAGRRDQNYQSLLARLNWKDFYARQQGFYFVENLKSSIQAVYHPDYVFVDSRTGLTDISGICTLQLPDLVVLLFGLNDQNLLGTANIYRSIVHNTLNRRIETLLVASPVPDVPEFISIKQERLNRSKELLGTDPDLVLPFNAFVAFKETIIPSEMGNFLNQAYDALCEKIISYNKADIDTLLLEARNARRAGDFDRAKATYLQVLEANPRNSIARAAYASFLRSMGNYQEALQHYLEAEKLGAGPRIYRDISVTLLYANNVESARSYLDKYLASGPNPRAVLQAARTFAYREQPEAAIRALKTIANTPDEIGLAASGEIGNLFLQLGRPADSLPYYESALKLFPNNMSSVYNIAIVLARLGRSHDARQWFEKTTALFEQFALSRMLPADRANIVQAVSQAYAAIGNFPRAIALVKEAMEIASVIPTPIFSSIQYRNLQPEDFSKESGELLARYMDASAKPLGTVAG